nr:hypothetical protein OG461_34675 [Streptomyces sp. NBC_00995]
MPARVCVFSRSASNSAGTAGMSKNVGHRVGRVVDAAAREEADTAGDEGLAAVAGVGGGAGEPVEFGYGQGVAGADEGRAEAGPGATGAGESLAEVHPAAGDAEHGEGLALGGEVLFGSRASGVAEEFSHRASVPFDPPSPDAFAYHLGETASVQVERFGQSGPGCLQEGSPDGRGSRPRSVP